MAIIHVANGTAASTNSGPSVAPGIPAGLQSGDLMVLCASIRNDAGFSTPAGWTLISSQTGGGLGSFWWYRFWQSGDAAPTVSSTSNSQKAARIAAFRGVHTVNPINVTGAWLNQGGAGGSLGPIPGITPTVADFAVLVFGVEEASATGFATLTGDGLTWVEAFEQLTDSRFVLDYAIRSGAAHAITDKTFTVSGGGSAREHGQMISLSPAPTGPQIIPIGQVTETDSLLALSAIKSRALGQVSETDSVSPITARKTFNLGLAIETDQAIALIVPIPQTGIGARYISPGLGVRRTHANWKIYLAHSEDLEPIGELAQNQSKSISYELNESGSLRIGIPLLDRMAIQVEPVATCILAVRRGKIEWSGPIWTVEESVPDAALSINAVGWFELLRKRVLEVKGGVQVQYADKDAGEIALDLLQRTNESAPTLILPGTVEATQPRKKTYERYVNIGDEIKSLSEIEAGYDFAIDPITRELNIYHTFGSVKPDVLMGYKTGPHNIASLTRQRDASVMVNRMYVQGKGYAVGPADDAESQNIYGQFQEVAQLTDVVNEEILNAYAVAELVYRRTPRVTYAIVPQTASQGGAPFRPFDDYRLGDTIRLSANYGSLVVREQSIRIFGIDIEIDAEGNEKVTSLKTAAS